MSAEKKPVFAWYSEQAIAAGFGTTIWLINGEEVEATALATEDRYSWPDRRRLAEVFTKKWVREGQPKKDWKET
jgi:hypothetical protein